ncbi:hypothetical protein [Acetobacterium bakii]|uniref:Uncharacterized protein n=1 Tax=Acetobacterium bakii TaxID=52689 RepID=A0A0L6TY33_9FIRM|nr:hypothetical protein [Acetobacterium bakii]KNZ40470.1 hypothetical protein AKG39_17545 [Acetobacterium bakii]
MRLNSQSHFNFEDVTAVSVEKYLSLKGWKRDTEFRNENLMVFDSEFFGARIAIPSSEKFDDFESSFTNFLETIALLEERNEKEILKEIIASYNNMIEIRVVSDFSKNGKLPLSYAADCMKGLKDLILYSTCAEENPQPVCYRPSDRSKKFVDKFKLGQTEKGSFIFNIEAQVENIKNIQMVISEYEIKPLEYRVIQRLEKALEQIDRVAIAEEKISNLTEDGYLHGATANMCEALLKLKPENEQVKIFATIRYASTITKVVGKKDCAILDSKHFWVMDEISKIYRDKTFFQDVILTGIVTSLAKKEHDHIIKNTIHFTTMFDKRYRSISISLSDEDYRLACDTHRDGVEVQISGELDMSKNKWNITKVYYFKLV